VTTSLEVVSLQPSPEQLRYTFGGGGEPLLRVAPGTVVELTTEDCFGGRVRSADDLPSRVCEFPYLNPVTGPIHVDGAEPGDTLAVHFVSIEPSRDWGVSCTVPFFGGLTSTPTTATLQAALPELTWRYELDPVAREVHFAARQSEHRMVFPLDPMHGTVGVAPPLGEVRSALTPGSWGGNMDTPEMRVGATCYLGVNVPGAMLSLGDGHARQGEGEACGVAVECAMDTTVVVELIKGAPCAWPRIETDEYLMTTGSTKPLEDAFRVATTEMVGWIAELTGLSPMDAYQVVSQGALTPIANVCDTVYTVVSKFPKALLGQVEAFGGKHAALRAQAARLG
jgi:acetamidase/formamidase